MTYVIWDDGRPQRPPAAAVSQPPDDPKALAKQFAGKSENEYTPDEYLTSIRLAGARRQGRL